MTEPVGLLALFAILFVKEAGVPIPVPGDLIVIAAGIAAAAGQLDPVVAAIAIVVAGVLGGSVQFLLVRGGARRTLLTFLDRIGVGRGRIEDLSEVLRRSGARGVAAGRVAPGLRVVTVAASGLAGMPFLTFLTGLTVGNTLFAGVHYALGFTVGEPALRLVAGATLPLTIGLAATAVIGAVGWWFVRTRRTSARTGARGKKVTEALFPAWADACCPACLAAAAVGDPRVATPQRRPVKRSPERPGRRRRRG